MGKKIDAFISALEELGDGRYHYWTGKKNDKNGIGCSEYVKFALQKVGIISDTESFKAGQSYTGVLDDKTRFEKIPWSQNNLMRGDILWSHGYHVAVWAGDDYKSLYEAAPEKTHTVATCGTGVGLHKSHTCRNCGTGTYTWACIYRIIENTDSVIDVTDDKGGNNSTMATIIKSSVLKQRVIDVCLGKYGNTAYNNKYPYNVGKYVDKTWTFDCLGFVHTLVNGFVGDKSQLGGGAVMDEFVLACSESDTLKTCTTYRKFNGVEPKEMTLLQSSGHVGFYIGEYKVTRKNGTVDVYNTAECTPVWGGGCLLSWTDLNNGNRFNKKGGEYRSTWNYVGELGRVDYTNQTETEPIMNEPEEKENSVELSAIEKLKIAVEVCEGKWGVNPDRKANLTEKYGSDNAIEIQDLVTRAF